MQTVWFIKKKKKKKKGKKTLVERCGGSEWLRHKPSKYILTLSDLLPFHFSGVTQTHTHTQISGRYTDAHTVLASLSSLGRLYCFTADCEDGTKWSWWSLYFPSQLTNQFHILFSPRPPVCLTPPLSLSLLPKSLTQSQEWDKHPWKSFQ